MRRFTRNTTLKQELSNVLNELAELMMKKGEPMKERAYNRARDTIKTIDQDITNIEQLKNIPTIGTNIYNKLDEYIKTGKIALLEKYKNDPVIVFTNIYGVGPKKADELVKKQNIQKCVKWCKKYHIPFNNIQF